MPLESQTFNFKGNASFGISSCLQVGLEDNVCCKLS